MTLSEIKGHESPIRMIEGARRRGRLATSYLFAGEAGIGKRTTALAFSTALNCKEPVEGSEFRDPCGECGSCRKMLSGTHPDFVLVEPDGAQIKVEQIRKVEEALSYHAFEGGMKVVVVDNADRMNPAAANAFLKTLEEPASHSLIILVSSLPDRMPSTIRSRCSRLNFHPLSDADCLSVLEAAGDSSEAAVRLCMGRPGSAHSEDLVVERDAFLDTLDLMLGGEAKPPWKDREETERFLDTAMVLLRDLAAAKTGATSGFINADIQDEVVEMSARSDLKQVLDCYDRLRSLRDGLFFNLNQGITWNYTASLMGGLRLHG